MATDPTRTHSTLQATLRAGLNPVLAQAEAALLAEIEGAMGGGDRPLSALCADLAGWLDARHLRIDELQEIADIFSARIGRATDRDTRRAEILEFARALGASGRDLRRDAQALARSLDFDAVAERCARLIGKEERRLAFGLGRLGKFAGAALSQAPDDWAGSRIEAAVVRALHHQGDPRVRTAGFICLKDALSVLPAGDREHRLGERALAALLRSAFARDADVAIQIAALDALSCASTSSFSVALRERLGKPGAGDDFWVRRAAVRLLCQQVSKHPPDLLDLALHDPSPAVRQALAAELASLTDDAARCVEHLANDPDRVVRAQALVALPSLSGDLRVPELVAILSRVMRNEADNLVLRTALHVAVETTSRLGTNAAATFHAAMLRQVDRLHVEAPSLAVRRWAAQAREQMWCHTHPQAATLLRELRAATHALREGQATRVPAIAHSLREDPDLVARVLAVLAQRDFGYQIEASSLGRAPRVRRGDRFRFRSWRAWHEFRASSPEKRQGHPHTLGRVYDSDIIAPSAIMAELAPTKVPGEPVHMGEEDGWRPYLPLPDLALSAIDKGAPVRIATSEGMTELAPPAGFLRRLRSRMALSRRFAQLAALRNWSRNRSREPDAYLATLKKLGFAVRIEGHGDGRTRHRLDPAVSRFFPVVVPILPPDFWRRLEVHFFSLYQNTLLHLAVFLGAVGVYFVGRHAWANARIRRARRAIPLVIGGWGTRGKSGTERIKAALLNGLGLSVVSKTTGNEAMVLQGDAFGALHELFLYRPYDKATIWEQADVLHLARNLKADAMLWECMALNPSYVTVLQRHWMQDDISTITNTYPDHEDIQGPAGRNIPEVMTKFIPRRSVLLTSEEQMRPILAEAAQQLETRLEGVGWLEAGLLPPDALARFPYEEHPYNIALVLKLADELGVDRDFALREMADRVVPDLGVLKAYPVAEIDDRQLGFVMGMSANERFGAHSNWVRMGFDRQDPYNEPGVWITAVVNNRADRVPRSKVFAEFLVEDVALDRMVLIGSNLAGMRGYLNDAWGRFESGLTLFPDQSPDTPADRLEATARRMRIAYTHEHLVQRTRPMLERIGITKDDIDAKDILDPGALGRAVAGARPDLRSAILDHAAAMRRTVEEYEAIAQALATSSDRARLDQMFRQTVRGWFDAKITVIEDFDATGDAVITALANLTPPGFLNRVMGVQNIKGTGLDFVYRWQAWEQVARACDMAESTDPHLRAEGIQRLAAFREFGVASETRVRRTLAHLRRQGDLGPALDARIALAAQELDDQMTRVKAEMVPDRRSQVWGRLLAMLEALLEPWDSIRRRRRAQRIYRDLAGERISRPRAAYELKRITLRQKGGWLFSEGKGSP
jgi:gamma-polyglutamate synthase